jgi:hypothetical protein
MHGDTGQQRHGFCLLSRVSAGPVLLDPARKFFFRENPPTMGGGQEVGGHSLCSFFFGIFFQEFSFLLGLLLDLFF